MATLVGTYAADDTLGLKFTHNLSYICTSNPQLGGYTLLGCVTVTLKNRNYLLFRLGQRYISFCRLFCILAALFCRLSCILAALFCRLSCNLAALLCRLSCNLDFNVNTCSFRIKGFSYHWSGVAGLFPHAKQI